MKRLMMITLACAAFSAVTTTVFADDNRHAEAEAQKSYAVKGEVVDVNMAASKVKLKHAAVPELKWPAMTMFFAVADKSQLEGLKAGNPVVFEFVETSGTPLITQIKPGK